MRSYTERDVELVRRIHYLTRECGYTLEGVREQLRVRPIEDPKQQVVNNLLELRQTLVALKETI